MTVGAFPQSAFLARRQRVMDSIGDGVMVLPAAPTLFRAGDSALSYRPDSELFYLTGFIEPDAVLVLRGFAKERRSVLFSRPRDPDAERWTGPRAGPEQARAFVGVDEARSIDRLDQELAGLLEGADRVFFRLGKDARTELLVRSALQAARAKGARRGVGPRGVMDPGVILDELRLRKDPLEVEAIRGAARITVEGLRVAFAQTQAGMGEWEVQAELEAAFRRLGAAGPAFATIVGSGENGCVLHYVDNSRRMEDGDLVLIDAGAEAGMYSGDVSRTAPVSGRFSPEQREVYQVVERARRLALEAIRPGVRISEVHAEVVRSMVHGLCGLGVLSGAEEELLEAGACSAFFPHRTSHWLGLETHDVGDYAQAGESIKLEPGMVLTIEPGLYFAPGPESGAFEGIGIRVEDDVLVTKDGGEVLSAGLPTDPDEVASLIGTGSG